MPPLTTREGESETESQIQGIQEQFASFDANRDTKFIVHGWMSDETHPDIVGVREEYFDHMNVNVIMVNWPYLASLGYIDSVGATETVGGIIAELIDYMVTNMGVCTDRIHIIGHSLGAQVAGFAGQAVTQGRLRRITGLDPARPGFISMDPSRRLDRTDAEFVDVIHTAGGTLGLLESIGDVDFYPNGGVNQPHCFPLIGKLFNTLRPHRLFC